MTLPQLINARRTQHGLRTLLALVPPGSPGERRAYLRAPGAGRPSRTRNRKRRPTAACEKGGGCAQSGRWPFRERWANGCGQLWGSLTIPSLPFHLRRVAADSAMDLAGLLLDEEGTFSLSDFQDFTVRAQSAYSLLLVVVTPQRSPPDPSGMGAFLLAMPWIGRLLRAMPTWRPMPLGPEGKASGYKGTACD